MKLPRMDTAALSAGLLRATPNDRKVMDVSEFTEADIAAPKAARAPGASKAFNDEIPDE